MISEGCTDFVEMSRNEFRFSDDGRVTRSEYTTYQTRHDPELEGLAHALFNVYDVNDDHHLVMDDYVAFYRSMDSDGRWPNVSKY